MLALLSFEVLSLLGFLCAPTLPGLRRQLLHLWMINFYSLDASDWVFFTLNRTDCTLWTFQMFQTLQVLSIAQSVCVPVPLYGTWQCYFSSGENNPLYSSSWWPFSSHFNLWPSHMPPDWLILVRQQFQNSEIKVFPSITLTLLPCPSNQGLSNAPT